MNERELLLRALEVDRQATAQLLAEHTREMRMLVRVSAQLVADLMQLQRHRRAITPGEMILLTSLAEAVSAERRDNVFVVADLRASVHPAVSSWWHSYVEGRPGGDAPKQLGKLLARVTRHGGIELNSDPRTLLVAVAPGLFHFKLA